MPRQQLRLIAKTDDNNAQLLTRHQLKAGRCADVYEVLISWLTSCRRTPAIAPAAVQAAIAGAAQQFVILFNL